MKIKHIIPAVMLLGVSLTAPVQACSYEPMLGSMCVFAGNFAPRGYALAHGQILSIAQNTALFALLGTTYGGNGMNTFALPDTRGRSLIGAGQGPGMTNYWLGSKGGYEFITLSTANLPAHTHSASTNVQLLSIDSSASSAVLKALAGNANSNTPTGRVLANSPGRDFIYSDAVPNVALSSNAVELNINLDMTFAGTTTVAAVGNNAPVDIRDPYLAVNWLIALTGFFPARE